MYLDAIANNLYGWAVSQYLPSGGFRWVTEKEINKIDLVEYPPELHNLHNDYPLLPEKIKVTREILSPYCKSIREKFNITIGQVHKLIPTLGSKEKYVLHYRNLQLYTDLGLKVTKVYRVLEFNQSPWLMSYIDFNTHKKSQAKNSFEKKLLQTHE